MKSIRLLLLAILLSPTAAYGGQIFGTLTVDNRPVGTGIRVAIACDSGNGGGQTDAYGAYKVFVPKGKCTLKVSYGGQEILFALYSYDDPVRYDFSIVRQSDGRYALQRR